MIKINGMARRFMTLALLVLSLAYFGAETRGASAMVGCHTCGVKEGVLRSCLWEERGSTCSTYPPPWAVCTDVQFCEPV